MADISFPLLVLLSSSWNLVLSWSQNICSGPFHLQLCRFFLCPLELPPPSVLKSLDVSGFLRKKLSHSWDSHGIPVGWRQFLNFKLELDTPMCCKQTQTYWHSCFYALGCPSLCSIPSPSPFFPSKSSSLLKNLIISHLLHVSDCFGPSHFFF